MEWHALANKLFPDGHSVQCAGDLLSGTGRCGEHTVTVIGTANHAAIGVEIAFAMAEHVLATIRDHPARPILILVDTQGQRLRHRDELLGINAYMAHLAKCLELARRNGHRILSLVYGDAVSGGYLASGMMADACFALHEAEISVMNLPAMARVTKIAQERLEELSKTSPVFAPGSGNYFKMGALNAIWEGDLALCLKAALGSARTADIRRELAAERGGRAKALEVSRRVRDEAAA
ncbi:MAG: biotin-independent malonate decarboxylase subunit gamma [Burkholderiales bacterium]